MTGKRKGPRPAYAATAILLIGGMQSAGAAPDAPAGVQVQAPIVFTQLPPQAQLEG